jgi:superfamily II DNA or RNA helicase
VVREPLAWTLADLEGAPVTEVYAALARCERGTWLDGWNPPVWLLAHQVPAAHRVAGSLQTFGGALLADAVGMGKTYVALAVATRYRRVAAVVPANLITQWQRVAAHLSIPISAVSHERLSRGGDIPPSDLVIIDEAHRMRNPDTVRYDRCSRTIGAAHVLLVTASPVVNRPADLVHLLRLFLSDTALGFLGVPLLDGTDDPAAVGQLARAATRLTVARSIDVLSRDGAFLPAIREGAVVRAPTVSADSLAPLMDALSGLDFPGVPSGAQHLLRAHLWHRLASSVAALRETVRRHLAYTDRALACGHERPPGRAIMREMLGSGDDLQFELAVLWSGAVGHPASPGALIKEREQLLSLLHDLPATGADPKMDRLLEVLEGKAGKAIVFCTSAATAQEAARRLCWTKLALVACGRARIASGPISIDAALDLFAPRARGRRPATVCSTPIDLLIATDLVSEGLDLQDADTVVHYDLPWTPLRVAQRIGRIVRLGSTHSAAHVVWFAPPPVIANRLGLEQRLARKVEIQLALSVPGTSRVGRARVVNATLQARERVCAHSRCDVGTALHHDRTAFALVRGPLVLAAGLRWTLASGVVDELLVIGGSPPVALPDYGDILAVVARLRRCRPAAGDLPEPLRRALFDTIRTRLRVAAGPTVGTHTRRLRRLVLVQGLAAGRRRDARLLTLLDGVLERLGTVRRMGALRNLDAIITGGWDTQELEQWLRVQSPGVDAGPGIRILGLLAGDGSVPAARVPAHPQPKSSRTQ